MRSLKAKTKSKKDGGKFSTIKYTSKDTSSSLVSSPDLSQLRKPIDISVCSLLQVIKLLDTGSNEIKNILAYECDIIYECRICKSLFRSLANLISHKRVYCKEKYNITFNKKALDDILGKKSLVDLEAPVKSKGGSEENEYSNRMLRSQVPQKDLNLDLTSVMDMIQEKRCEDNESSNSRSNEHKSKSTEITSDNQRILLEALGSSQSAVYQTVTKNTLSTVHTADLMKAQIIELQNMINTNTAVLGPNGRCIEVNEAEKTNNFIQSCDKNDNSEITDANTTNKLSCDICKAEFATKKTLAYHVKAQHTSYKMIYSCPCCSNSFRNTWSVYRHLYKFHRKSNEQVRKLRNQIQDKAYRKVCIEDQPPNSKIDNKRQKMTDENQEWMNQVESDTELQRCGGCGRRFDRKAALQSHLQLCQRRIAVCNGTANKTKKSGKIQSVDTMLVHNNSSKVVEKTPDEVPYSNTTDPETTPSKSNPSTSTESKAQDVATGFSRPSEENELSIRVDNISTLSTADWEMMGTSMLREKDDSKLNFNESTSTDSHDKESCSLINSKDFPTSTAPPDSPEILYTVIGVSQPDSVIVGAKRRKIDKADSEKVSAIGNDPNLQGKSLSSPSNCTNTTSSTSTRSTSSIVVSSFTQESDSIDNSSTQYDISTITNIRKLQCLKCRRKFASITNLRRHMAVHMGWNRYTCTLCDFKSFVKCDCLTHCNKVHNAKNNRALLEQMVVPISQAEGSPNQPVVIDIASTEDVSADLEIISATVNRSSERDDSISENTTGVDEIDAMKKPTSTLETKSFEVESNTATPVESNNGSFKISRNNTFEETEESLRREDASDSDCNESDSAEQEIRNTSLEKLQDKNNERPPFLTQNSLDGNPDLKRMVMEVIFGTAETTGVNKLDQTQIDSTCKIITENIIVNKESAKPNKIASTKDSNDNKTLNSKVMEEDINKKDQESSKGDDSGNKNILNHDQLRSQRSIQRIKLVDKLYTSSLPERMSRGDNIQKSVSYSVSKSTNAKLLTDKIPTVVLCRTDTIQGLCNINKKIT